MIILVPPSFGPFKGSRFLDVSDAAYFHVLRLSNLSRKLQLQLQRVRTAYIINDQQMGGRISHC